MNPDFLPLLNLFNYLRDRLGWVLGTSDYLAVVEMLEAGISVSNCEDVKTICSLLWAKSPQDIEQLNQLFDRLVAANIPKRDAAIENLFLSQPKTESPQPVSTKGRSKPPKPPSPVKSKDTTSTPSGDRELSLEPVVKVQQVRKEQLHLIPAFTLRQDYFPVTRRQMKQSWRYLRRPIREGVPTELDLDATVQKILRDGILSAPVLVPRRTNRTDLILLVDRQGSMVPFHQLSQQLIETAERGGRLRQTNVYYFHNCPDRLLFQNSALWQGRAMETVLAEAGRGAVILIVSDAGAARGFYNSQRIETTRDFIEQLRRSLRYFAWLNPMPEETWRGTTAEEIAKIAPMLSLNRQGLNDAIAILRGRLVTGV